MLTDTDFRKGNAKIANSQLLLLQTNTTTDENQTEQISSILNKVSGKFVDS
jgi:hypothetical protein